MIFASLKKTKTIRASNSKEGKKTDCMKRFVFLCIITIIFSNCSIIHPKYERGKSMDSWGRTDLPGNEKGPDSVVITGAQYIPLYGKSEAGINPDLEGTWEMESMEGQVVKGDVIERFKSLEASKYRVSTNLDSIITYTESGASITPKQKDNFHIPERPSINFYGANETFSGFTGCNRFSGRYEIADSNTLTLKNATPSTKMVCIGDYDEDKYIENLHKISKFKGTDEKLELLEGDKVILTFRRKK